MRTSAPLRPEIAAVCRFLGARPARRVVRPLPVAPPAGILAELADSRSAR